MSPSTPTPSPNGQPPGDPASTLWSKARPLGFIPQLCRTGSYERRGRLRRVCGRGETKRQLAGIAVRQAAETKGARGRLMTGWPVRLSRLGELDLLAFQLFPWLLGDALATWRPGMTSTAATSGDGSMEIRLTVLDDGSTAEVHPRRCVQRSRPPDRHHRPHGWAPRPDRTGTGTRLHPCPRRGTAPQVAEDQ
ncbi:DUF2397 family protein [Streptomyces achromogenes]|uniref:DUF2397 family protein n=1 Tax=Streptomyces achromogenes TaxID=67255 RepID=UPI003685339F